MPNAQQKRCSWVNVDNALMREYHDREWGVPVHDDRKYFEFLILEAAQAGLSWSIVLNKREGYRRAFSQFDPEKVARFSKAKIDKLVADPGADLRLTPNFYRNRGIGVAPLSQLSNVVSPPAIRTTGCDAACVAESGGDGVKGEVADNRDGNRARRRAAISQRTAIPRPPTVRRVIRCDSTNAGITGVECDECTSSAHGNGHQTADGRPISQLTNRVRTPAVRNAAGGDTARELFAGGYRDEGESAADRDWCWRICRGSVPEATVPIVSPAVCSSSGGHAARMLKPD